MLFLTQTYADIKFKFKFCFFLKNNFNLCELKHDEKVTNHAAMLSSLGTLLSPDGSHTLHFVRPSPRLP